MTTEPISGDITREHLLAGCTRPVAGARTAADVRTDMTQKRDHVTKGARQVFPWLFWIAPAVFVYGTVFIANHPAQSWADGHNPQALLQEALQRCQEVRDYRCTFIKQERVGHEMKPRQTLDVRYRQDPVSIHAEWVENVGKVRRAVYVAGRDVDADGREQVLVEPAGALARLFASRVEIPLRGEKAREASRYALDEYGFRPTLERIMAETRRFASAVDWDPVATAQVAGRPTYVLTRHLPRRGAGDPYPNAVLVIYLDQEWLLPIAITAYGDEQRQDLLEDYVCRDIVLNPGLSDRDFEF